MIYGDLVSIIIVTYNHEKFIEECLQAACSQTYPNYEVVVCDDCSTDKTFKLITNFVDNYKGQAKIRFYENEKNLGAVRNYEKCISLSEGEIIIEQDGDDVAMPYRAEETVRVFLSDVNIKALFGNAVYTDENGKDHELCFDGRPSYISTIKEFENSKFDLNHIFTPYVWMLGSTAAFTKEVYTLFDEIDPRARQEDGIFSFRSILLGKMEYIERPLIRYRRHSGSVSTPSNFKGRLKLLRLEKYYYNTQYNDAIKVGATKKTIDKVKFYRRIAWMKSAIFGMPFVGIVFLRMIDVMSRFRKLIKKKFII